VALRAQAQLAGLHASRLRHLRYPGTTRCRRSPSSPTGRDGGCRPDARAVVAQIRGSQKRIDALEEEIRELRRTIEVSRGEKQERYRAEGGQRNCEHAVSGAVTLVWAPRPPGGSHVSTMAWRWRWRWWWAGVCSWRRLSSTAATRMTVSRRRPCDAARAAGGQRAPAGGTASGPGSCSPPWWAWACCWQRLPTPRRHRPSSRRPLRRRRR
jgi:hypothetical protein